MAYFGLKLSFIILIFYSTFLNSANLKTENDSWLWPNEVDSVIDERPLIGTETLPSSSLDGGLSTRQKKMRIVYIDDPILVAGRQNKRNSSAWKRLKTTTPKTTTDSYFGVSKNIGSVNDKTTPLNDVHYQSSATSHSDWNFPEDNTVKRKSESKCAEYNEAIEDKGVWIHPLVGNWPATYSAQKTGQNKCKGLQNPLIIGGLVARPGEFSHVVALGWISSSNEASFLCGGSLVSDRWVITAAHCTHGPSGPPKVVRVGARRLGDKTAGRLISVEEIVRHPSYKPPAVYADLALLKLEKSVKFGSRIKPACLYSEFDTTPLQAWAAGWGVTGIGEEQSDELLKVRLDVVDNVDCALKLNRSAAIPRGIVPSMLCAGDITGDWRSDTCQGDSGGPLQVSHPSHKCLYQIVGITSFGRLCALRNSPGVYTRISHYLEWIERTVWPDCNQ